MTGPLRRLPALVLLVVLALLPLEAWLGARGERVVLDNETEGLRGMSWTGTLAADGRLAVRIAYDFGDDEERSLDLRMPRGARHLAVNGEPLTADIGLYATTPVRGSAVVTYEVPGLVTRYEDGALVRFAQLQSGSGTSLDGDQALFPCPRCYLEPVGYGDLALTGALYASGAEEATLRFANLRSIRVETDPGVIRFVGIDPGADAVSMLATLPSTAVPDVPVSPGSVDEAVDAVLDELEPADETFRRASGDRPTRVAYAVLLTLMFVALVAWIVHRLRRAREERRGTDGGDRDPTAAPFERPSELEPALAGLVVGEAGRGERSVVAGTLLELAHRGVIDIDGVDSERFVLTVPAGARGRTVFEEAVLGNLRPQGQVSASATLTGPPLWGPQGEQVARRLARVLGREAMKARLVRRTLSFLVLVPASVAMGIVALLGSDGLSALGVFAVAAGPLLAIAAALLTGVSLTGRGRDERTRWIEYADWLRTNSQLARVGAPGVATWGEMLPHAAALGAAPEAATALSPRHGS